MGFLHKYYTGRYRPARVCHPGEVDCPERKEHVPFVECVECEKFQIFHEKDGEMKRCYYEFKDLKSRGFYDGTWDDHPENFDPETFARIQEQKRVNEEVNREMESERSELKRRAEEIAEEPYYYYEDFGTNWEEETEEDDQDQKEDEEEEYY